MNLTLSRIFGVVFFMGTLFLFSACDGSSTGDADPTGYYDVTVSASVEDNNGANLPLDDLQAIVSGTRMMMMSVSNGLLYDGTITQIDKNSFTADFVVYTFGGNPMSATVAGTITQGSRITGTLTGTGAGSGSFELSYATANNQTAAISRVENNANNLTWAAFVGGGLSEYELIVENDGVLVEDVGVSTGVFQLCQFDFAVSTILPITGTNLYDVSASVGVCANAAVTNTNYTGLATTRTQANADDTLVFMMTSGAYGFYGDFQ